MFRSPPVDLIVILIIALLILGPKRLPGIGRGLGQGMREFKDGITGQSKDDDGDTPTLSQTSPMPESQPGSTTEHPAASRTGTAGSERP